MPSSRILGKVDCFSKYYNSSQNDGIYMMQETYVGLFKFLEYLQTQGLTTLITYFSGAGGTGTGKDYWNTANAVGTNAFSVWRFNQYKDRNWDWYLYIHYMTGQTYQSISNSIPTRVDNGVTDVSATTAAIVAQAAFSISGSSSINPWNGTINLSGAAYKTTPVWNTGSTGYSVHVFPRINNASGAFSTSKDLCMMIKNVNYLTTNVFSRYHFLSDGHGLLLLQESRGTQNVPQKKINVVTYFGPFRLNKNITDNNQGFLLGGTSSYGFAALTTATDAGNTYDVFTSNTMPEGTTIGNLTTNTSTMQGGVFATSPLGVRTMQISNDSSVVTTTYMPNVFLPSNKLDERMYSVYSVETSYSGFLGWIETPLLRCIVGDYFSYDKSADGNRVIFSGDFSSTANRRITVPWTGSSPGTNLTREGRIFDISKSYW